MKKFITNLLILCIALTGVFTVNINASDIYYGDADNNGILTANDSACILQKALNSSYIMPVEEKDNYLKIVDVNKDNAITSLDAAIVLLKVLNGAYVMPVEEAGDSDTDVTEQSTEQSTEESTEQSTEQSTEESTEQSTEQSTEESTEQSTEQSTEESTEQSTEAVTYQSDIVLSDNSITVNGLTESNGGVEIYNEDNYIIITDGGSYNISGTLTDGQIVVNSATDVELNLSNVSVTNTKGSAIYGLNGDIDISAKKGTVNTLTDGTPTEVDADGEPDACIYSKDGLKLKGTGTLVINGTYGNGVSGKDEVIIQKLNLTINSADNAIKAKDSLTVTSGTLNLTSETGDGMRCTKGDVVINDGTITINDINNGIYAKVGNIIVNGGSIEIVSNADVLDTANYDYDGIKAKTSVFINGGEVNVTAGCDGIQATVNTEITAGTITVNAGDVGIAADADVIISGGEVNVTAVDKGINSSAGNITISDSAVVTVNTTASSNDVDTATYNYDGIHSKAGSIAITGGTVNVSSYCDGIQAAATLSISGDPVINVTTTGVITSSSSENGFNGFQDNQTADISAKGIKSDTDIAIDGGTITVNSTDDSIHSNNNITLNGGKFTLTSGDDGVHADSVLTINDGAEILISDCYEGIEGESIYINGGTIYIYAKDDSINGAGGNDSSSAGGFNTGSTGYIEINGGYIYCENTQDGDGIDSNGCIVFNGGVMLINGPSSGGNSAIDYGDNSSDYMAYNSGTIIAVAGTSDMAAYPTANYSNGYTLVYGGDSQNKGGGGFGPGNMGGSGGTISANTLITLADSSGNVVLAFKPVKSTGNVIFSSDNIKSGETYTMYTGGTYSGDLNSNGYGEGGTISNGTKVASATVASKLTKLS